MELVTGEIFPLSLKNELAYLPMRLPTDEEMNGGLPQCIFTSDQVWDPTIYTDKFTIEEQLKNLEYHPAGIDTAYDELGELVLSTSINELVQSASIDNDDNGNATVSSPKIDTTDCLNNNFHFVNTSENFDFENSKISKSINTSTRKSDPDQIGLVNIDNVSLDKIDDPINIDDVGLDKIDDSYTVFPYQNPATSKRWNRHRRWKDRNWILKRRQRRSLSPTRPSDSSTKQRTNKHKFNQSWNDRYDSNFNVSSSPSTKSEPSFREHVSIDIDESNFNLPSSIYDSALQEGFDGEIYMDSLEEI